MNSDQDDEPVLADISGKEIIRRRAIARDDLNDRKTKTLHFFPQSFFRSAAQQPATAANALDVVRELN